MTSAGGRGMTITITDPIAIRQLIVLYSEQLAEARTRKEQRELVQQILEAALNFLVVTQENRDG